MQFTNITRKKFSSQLCPRMAKNRHNCQANIQAGTSQWYQGESDSLGEARHLVYSTSIHSQIREICFQLAISTTMVPRKKKGLTESKESNDIKSYIYLTYIHLHNIVHTRFLQWIVHVPQLKLVAFLHPIVILNGSPDQTCLPELQAWFSSYRIIPHCRKDIQLIMWCWWTLNLCWPSACLSRWTKCIFIPAHTTPKAVTLGLFLLTDLKLLWVWYLMWMQYIW